MQNKREIKVPTSNGVLSFKCMEDAGNNLWVEAKSLQNAVASAKGKAWKTPYYFSLELRTQKLMVSLYRRATGEDVKIDHRTRKPLSQWVAEHCYFVEGSGRGAKTWMTTPLFLAYATWLSSDIALCIYEAYEKYGFINDLPSDVKSMVLSEKTREAVEEEVIEEMIEHGEVITPHDVVVRTEARIKGISARLRLASTLKRLFAEGDYHYPRLLGRVSKAINYRLLGCKSEVFHDLINMKKGSPRTYLTDDFLTAIMSVESKLCAFIDHELKRGIVPSEQSVLAVARALADAEHQSLFKFVDQLVMAQCHRKLGKSKGDHILMSDGDRQITHIHLPKK